MDSGMDPQPAYLDSVLFIRQDKLSVDKELIESQNIKSKEIYPVLTFSNILLNKISGDDFSLKAVVRSESISKENICTFYEILLKGTSGVIRVPITQPGCYGIASIHCSDKVLSGKSHDLSSLSTELSHSHAIGLLCKNKLLSITVGANDPMKILYNKEIGQLKVIKFIFNGTAEIAAFELKKGSGQKVKAKELYPFN